MTQVDRLIVPVNPSVGGIFGKTVCGFNRFGPISSQGDSKRLPNLTLAKSKATESMSQSELYNGGKQTIDNLVAASAGRPAHGKHGSAVLSIG